MKKDKGIFILLASLILVGAGCNLPTKEVVNNLETVDLIEQENTENNDYKPDLSNQTKDYTYETSIYRGSWFDIGYPKEFVVRPLNPIVKNTNSADNLKKRVNTDEAYFLSPDDKVEFYVYSPLWAGDDPGYMSIDSTEEMVSEDKEEIFDEESSAFFGDYKITSWVTIKAKDGSYYRSFVSIKEQVTPAVVHQVFGIKYSNKESYEYYKQAYLNFKGSLVQYSD